MNDSFRILLEEEILSDEIQHSVALLEGPIKQTERSVQVHVCMQSVIRVSDCTLHILMPVLLFVCCVVGVSHAHAQKVVRKYYRDHR